MSTPAEQYIPPEFQDTIDLPSSTPTDPRKAAAAQAALTSAKGKVTSTKAALDAQKKNAARWSKGLTPAQKKSMDARTAAAQKAYDAAMAAQASSQNNVYEVSGQYDKLLSGANRDAFMALKSMFDQFGLGSLAGKIYDYTKQGYGAGTRSPCSSRTPRSTRSASQPTRSAPRRACRP
jgi:hypothetical protein